MLNPAFVTPALLALLASSASLPDPAPPEPPVTWEGAAALVAQHITIHVPRMTVTTTVVRREMRPPVYREKNADDCVKMKKVVGYAVSDIDSVDLILDDGTRLRAKLGSDCPALGFYSGFYVKPNPDGKLCTRRDVLRGRSGVGCSIDAFKKLVAER